MQYNPSRWLWGLIPIAMLTLATFYRERPAIEAELSTRAVQTLKRVGQPWADVAFEGRDATVSGTAEKDGEPKSARDAVFDTWGVRVVKLKTDIASAQAPIAPAVGPKAGLAAVADDDRAAKASAETDAKATAEKVQAEADAKAAAEKAQAEADAKAAAEKAQAEADAKAAAEKVQAEADAKAAAEKAQAEADAKAAAEKAQAEADAKAAAEKAQAEVDAKAAAEKAQAEADAKAAAEKAQAEADAKAAAEKAQAEADAKAAAEKAQAEADAKAAAEKAQAEADAKAAAEKAQAEADAKAAAEKAQAEADAKAAAEKAQAEADAKAAAEKARMLAEAKAKRDAEVASRKTTKETKACEARLTDAVKKDKILFERASDELTGKSVRTISRLAAIARSCPGLKIEIQGHTDNEGETERNQNLSERRANRVKSALEEAGIAPDRLSTIGFGATQPLVGNSSPENMALNRRIEFKVFVK